MITGTNAKADSATPPASCAGASFRIGTQNLWHYPKNYKERLEGLKEGLGEGLPAIMGFQEAWRYSGNLSLFDEFVRRTGYQSYFARTSNWLVMQEGDALASKFPIEAIKTVGLPHTQALIKRTVIQSVIKTPVGRVHVLVTHLNPFEKARDIRADQIDFIAKLIGSLPANEAVILMGDMNDGLASGIFKPLLQLGFKSAGDGKISTYDPANPYSSYPEPSAIDHIFYRPAQLELGGVGLMFVEKPISDHYGLWADFCAAVPAR